MLETLIDAHGGSDLLPQCLYMLAVFGTVAAALYYLEKTNGPG